MSAIFAQAGPAGVVRCRPNSWVSPGRAEVDIGAGRGRKRIRACQAGGRRTQAGRGGGRRLARGIRSTVPAPRRTGTRSVPADDVPARDRRGLHSGSLRPGLAQPAAIRGPQQFRHLAAPHRGEHRPRAPAATGRVARCRRVRRGRSGGCLGRRNGVRSCCVRRPRSGHRQPAARRKARARAGGHLWFSHEEVSAMLGIAVGTCEPSCTAPGNCLACACNWRGSRHEPQAR